jgi:hypothetical protein
MDDELIKRLLGQSLDESDMLDILREEMAPFVVHVHVDEAIIDEAKRELTQLKHDNFVYNKASALAQFDGTEGAELFLITVEAYSRADPFNAFKTYRVLSASTDDKEAIRTALNYVQVGVPACFFEQLCAFEGTAFPACRSDYC